MEVHNGGRHSGAGQFHKNDSKGVAGMLHPEMHVVSCNCVALYLDLHRTLRWLSWMQ